MAESGTKLAPGLPITQIVSTSAERELEVLREFVVHLLEITDVGELCWYVAKEVVGRLGFVDCVVYRFDVEAQTLVQSAAIGEKNPEREVITNKLVIPLGEGITGQVAMTKTTEIVADLSRDPRYITDLMEARSEICVPLVHDGQILGVIDCEDPREDYFTQKHVESLAAIASITSSHMTQCHMMEELTGLSADLEVALRQSQTAQRAQAAFLANVSHELRTPLNAIVGFSTVLLGDEETPCDNKSVVEYAQYIHQAGLHLTSIVSDILDIAALASEKSKPTAGAFVLRQRMDEALRLVANKARRFNVEITSDTEGSDITVWFDPRHFSQILTNLLDNAIKYGASGGRVVVSVARRDQDSMIVSVEDFGIGISEENINLMFEPFTRDPAVMDEGTEGAGLGLCVARELAIANGGDIEVKSTLGEGSTFSLIVPLPR